MREHRQLERCQETIDRVDHLSRIDRPETATERAPSDSRQEETRTPRVYFLVAVAIFSHLPGRGGSQGWDRGWGTIRLDHVASVSCSFILVATCDGWTRHLHHPSVLSTPGPIVLTPDEPRNFLYGFLLGNVRRRWHHRPVRAHRRLPKIRGRRLPSGRRRIRHVLRSLAKDFVALQATGIQPACGREHGQSVIPLRSRGELEAESPHLDGVFSPFVALLARGHVRFDLVPRPGWPGGRS